ncbi:MAG TPA: alpha/beta hydrolase [Allosphingosinicella sp.]|jgi:hypothetical protein
MTRLAFLLSALALAFTAAPADAQTLPRRAGLGVSLGPLEGGAPGVSVRAVLPGQTGEALGLREGDVILRAGAAPVAAVPDVVAYAGRLATGAPVELTVRRAGREMRLRGRARARPLESWDGGARVDYGAVPWRGGQLRDILVTPANATADTPVVFLIQGFSCASIDSIPAAHPYRALGTELVRQGIAYYRVEKAGLGDSAGTPSCADIDFAAEMEGFAAAYRHLVETRGISADRIFMFGHSLGGYQAPLLAAERAPRGVAVYGTLVKSWGDYHRDLMQFQPFTHGGEDPVAVSARNDSDRELFRRYYFLRQSPSAIAAESPDSAARLREILNWDGGERAMGRHWKFMQDLAHVPVIPAWRDTRSNVLAMYGEADFAALWDEDHRLIVDMVNHWRPGTARFLSFARTGHGMELEGTKEEIRARNIAGTEAPQAPFNAEVPNAVAAWIRESMARPPVGTQAQPSPAPAS